MASRLFSLDGRVALVSGASRGLGFAMARALGAAGATVWLNARDPAALQALTLTYCALPCALKLLAAALLHWLWIRAVPVEPAPAQGLPR